MVGFYSGDPISSQAIEQQGLASVPSTTSEALGADFSGAFADGYSMRIGRSLQRAGVSGLDPEGIGSSLPGSEGTGGDLPGLADMGPTLTPDEANAKYGIKGMPPFEQPISDAAAADIYRAKHADALRQDVINRAPNTFGVQTAASFAGGLMDPTNLALGLIPGVEEAAVARTLGGGVLAQLGGRAVEGATAGAFGMAASEPVNALLDSQEHTDWSMSQALRDVAFGGLLGGGLHTVLGGFAARPAAAVADRIEAAGPEARESLLQGALGQMMDDRPVTAAPALDAVDADRAGDLSSIHPLLPEWQATRDALAGRLGTAQDALDAFSDARDARLRGEAPDSLTQYDTPQAVDQAYRMRQANTDAMQGRLALLDRGIDRMRTGEDPGTSLNFADPAMNRRITLDTPDGAPQTMLARLRELGSLQDQGGELSARDLNRIPGMVRSGGLTLEDAAERMAEEGYLPGLQNDLQNNPGLSRVDHADALLSAIDEERSGRPQLRQDDVPAWDEAIARHEAAKGLVQTAAEELGITPAQARGLRRGHVLDLAAEAQSREAAAEGRLGPSDALEDDGSLASEGYGQMTADTFDRATDELRAAAMREDPSTVAVRQAADDAGGRQSGGLADLQAQIAELEQRAVSVPGEDRASAEATPDPAVDAAQTGVDEAEQRASAIQQAAACLVRSGL